MRTIEISDEDYRRLEFLGTDKWMRTKGEKPLLVEKVLHRCIEQEFKTACPPVYRAIQERGD